MAEETHNYKFIYKGTQYDAAHYVKTHPGGAAFIQNMNKQKKDFTEYFRALHSDKAEKVLESFPVVSSSSQPSASSQQYYTILQKVQHLYQPDWITQILLLLIFPSLFLVGVLTTIPLISILSFALSQVVLGWMGHSSAHSRDLILQKIGTFIAPLFGGLSITWWSPKHNMHHMFTNSKLYDGDIQHAYFVVLYPFLYFKWRFDSLVESFTSLCLKDMICVTINYLILFSSPGNLIYFVVGLLLGGFYAANVLIGNHERQVIYEGKITDNFIDHQIITCRNYQCEGFFWLIMMGGMQYQTQHHLFPQIPFYRLPGASKIIKNQLKKINKKIIYGPIL